jgi:hypothetical protein
MTDQPESERPRGFRRDRMSPADQAFQRLACRGTVEIRVHSGYGWRPIVLTWPAGQHGNPFVQANFTGDTLEEALVKAEEKTRPQYRGDIESAIHWRRWYLQMQADVQRKYEERRATGGQL